VGHGNVYLRDATSCRLIAKLAPELLKIVTQLRTYEVHREAIYAIIKDYAPVDDDGSLRHRSGHGRRRRGLDRACGPVAGLCGL
jgi:hypothetical protein